MNEENRKKLNGIIIKARQPERISLDEALETLKQIIELANGHPLGAVAAFEVLEKCRNTEPFGTDRDIYTQWGESLWTLIFKRHVNALKDLQTEVGKWQWVIGDNRKIIEDLIQNGEYETLQEFLDGLTVD